MCDQRAPLHAKPLDLFERGDVFESDHRGPGAVRRTGNRGGIDEDGNHSTVWAPQPKLDTFELLAAKCAHARDLIQCERLFIRIQDGSLVLRDVDGNIDGAAQQLLRAHFPASDAHHR